jgi:hypothetical protein
MESANWYDKIDDYLDGVLSVSERAAMDAALAQDSALARKVKAHRLEREALEVLSEDKARSDFMLWTEDTAQLPLAPKSGSWWSRHRWLISALGVLLTGLILWVNYPSILSNPEPDTTPTPMLEQAPVLSPTQPIVNNGTEQQQTEKPRPSDPPRQRPPDESLRLYAAVHEAGAKREFSDPDDIAMSRVRGGSNQDIQLSEAFKAYESAKNEDDYAKVGELLNKIEPNPRNYWLSIYLKGHAYFKSRQYEKAADVFRDVAAKGLPYPDAKWKEALSLYATGGKQKERLREILEHISDPEKQEKAKELLRTLE